MLQNVSVGNYISNSSMSGCSSSQFSKSCLHSYAAAHHIFPNLFAAASKFSPIYAMDRLPKWNGTPARSSITAGPSRVNARVVRVGHTSHGKAIYAGRTSRGKATQNCRPTRIEHKWIRTCTKSSKTCLKSRGRSRCRRPSNYRGARTAR